MIITKEQAIHILETAFPELLFSDALKALERLEKAGIISETSQESDNFPIDYEDVLNKKSYSEKPLIFGDDYSKSWMTDYISPACRNCSNHPSNGGSGICFCTLGTISIT